MNKKWLAIILAIVLTGCNKGNLELPPPSGATVSITVNVNENERGYPISTVFEGLSYETGLFGENPDFLNENNAVLIQLLKNLGKGILRIGGNSSDEIQWTGASRSANTPTTGTLTTTDVDHLAAFSKAAGWPVIFGLNLGKYNVDTAASEASYVSKSLKNNLYVLQSGNEPDVYKYKTRPSSYVFTDYQREWNDYFSAVKKIAPQTRFAGPDAVPFDPFWVNSFVISEHSNINLIDNHYYATGPASDPSITCQTILTSDPRLGNFLVQLNNIGIKYRLPYRISECNNVYGGGKPGVSDAFASALWALDFMWSVAESNGQGINFHGGPPHFAYSPITMNNGQVTAKPEYYAMLAFKYAVNNAKIIPATIVNPRAYYNCSSYACANADGSTSVTLINKDDSRNFVFTIKLDKTAQNIATYRLLAPSVISTSGVTFAGSGINADGSFAPSTIEEKTINSKTFVITVPAGSAAVVMVK
jgi:hypothetical protein